MVPLSMRENWQAWSLLLQRGDYFPSTYSILAMSGQLLTFLLLWGSQEAFWWLLDCFVPSLVAAQGQLELELVTLVTLGCCSLLSWCCFGLVGLKE